MASVLVLSMMSAMGRVLFKFSKLYPGLPGGCRHRVAHSACVLHAGWWCVVEAKMALALNRKLLFIEDQPECHGFSGSARDRSLGPKKGV